VQFKYSISREHVPARAADLAKTLKKFAKADADFVTKLGRERALGTIPMNSYDRPSSRSSGSGGRFMPDHFGRAQAQAEAIGATGKGDAWQDFAALTLIGEGGSLARPIFIRASAIAIGAGCGDALANASWRLRLVPIRRWRWSAQQHDRAVACWARSTCS
jgi:hypothetical protein